jgi:uncharacterized protein (DUF2267 family)
MRYDEFLKRVGERTGATSPDDSERTAVTVLQVLSERLAGNEPEHLLAQLPKELKERVQPVPEPNPMDPDEFVERVASDLGISPDEARERVRGVFDVLQDAVTQGEFEDVLSQLDREYAELIA